MGVRMLSGLLAVLAAASPPRSRWIYYPQNSEQSGVIRAGLHVYFESVTADFADVYVAAMRNGARADASGHVATDCRKLDACWLPMPTGDLRTFRVILMDIRLGDMASRIESPEIGRYYYFAKRE